jgi:hypothetical protein
MAVETDLVEKGGEGNARTPHQRQGRESSFEGASQRFDGKGEQDRRRLSAIATGQLPAGEAMNPT